MDASHKQGAVAGGGGEVRRINVVYFLSRGGRTDHPHLFRVNHLSRAGAGVRLRDVKRWLSELRGKDMPDNYSWSYKRKYKAGYVWQDLKDDDLITPVSDNEYVLKGCDVRGTPPPCVQAPRRTSSLGEKKRIKEEEEEVAPCNDDQNRPVEVVLTPDSDESSPKPPPPADQDSPGGCESARRSTAPFKLDKPPQGGLDEQKPQQEQVVIKIEVSRSQNHQRQKQQGEEKDDDAQGQAATETADKKAAAPAPVEQQQQQQPQPPPPPQGDQGAAAGGVSRGHAVGKQARRMSVARALHNMLTCGRADADDAALRPLARRQDDGWAPPPTPTCPGMDGCGLRVRRKATRPRKGGEKDKQRKRDGEKKHDAHKPASLPRCSQCGKEFKPQELHSHMQSCRGFKERMRSSTGARPNADRRRNGTAGHHHSSESERPSSVSAVFLLTES